MHVGVCVWSCRNFQWILAVFLLIFASVDWHSQEGAMDAKHAVVSGMNGFLQMLRERNSLSTTRSTQVSLHCPLELS
jgi:hypothetical protein